MRTRNLTRDTTPLHITMETKNGGIIARLLQSAKRKGGGATIVRPYWSVGGVLQSTNRCPSNASGGIFKLPQRKCSKFDPLVT